MHVFYGLSLEVSIDKMCIFIRYESYPDGVRFIGLRFGSYISKNSYSNSMITDLSLLNYSGANCSERWILFQFRQYIKCIFQCDIASNIPSNDHRFRLIVYQC